jgi:NAD(P)-dependent dehydrogenase (short-subunit alcohol dehydrogenase family)
MALVLVTGASTGLGLATARTLAEAGHQVVLHARNRGRIEDPAVLDATHAVITGDLADHAETVSVAEQANRIGRFDAVVHNAGVLHGPDVFAVNIVAPYLLTALLEPAHRSIFLSSSMHRSGSTDLAGIDFTDASGNRNAYEDSKLCLTAFAMALAARRPETLVHAVDPGWVPTRMGGPHASDDLTEGHRTQEWLAVADEAEIVPRTGGYWYHRATRSPHPATLDTGFQADLLAKLATLTGVHLT